MNQSQGQAYWRSLEELAGTPEFQEYLYREFPQNADQWVDPVGRRRFLQLMGASLALAGLSACTKQPAEHIVPYVKAPEGLVPGKPLFFASARSHMGISEGLLVESHMGRPTKVEGNPEHPASLGSTDVLSQASILTLYDPDRSQTVTQFGEIRSYPSFLGEMKNAVSTFRGNRGAGLHFLLESTSSPSLLSMINELQNLYPLSQWHEYDAVGLEMTRQGIKSAFGEDLELQYDFSKADVVLSLDADFLSEFPGRLRYTREFVSRRRLREGSFEMNRLYVVETTPTTTGSMADHRLPLSAAEIESFARALAKELGIPVESHAGEEAPGAAWIGPLAKDLRRSSGKSIVVAGEHQSLAVHVLAHAMNEALGNLNQTVFCTDPLLPSSQAKMSSLQGLVQAMASGKVETLVILGGNPVYTAPVDLNFLDALFKVKLRVHLGLYQDETSVQCHWHIPEAHFLESWGDGRAYDGTVTLSQPLIAPLYDGKTAHELLAALTERPDRTSYDIVREYWKANWPHPVPSVKKPSPATASSPAEAEDSFEQPWRQAVHDGFMVGTALPRRKAALQTDWINQLNSAAPLAVSANDSFEIYFRPDPHIFDGRFANNGWLQELPKPQTRLTWDNAALISQATARKLRLNNEEVVELTYRGRKIQAPVWILPGQSANAVTVHLGYGRTRVGRVGRGTGFNAYLLRTGDAPWFGSGLEIRKTGERYPLACTQNHSSMEGRNLVRAGTLEEFKQNPEFIQEMGEAPANGLSMYPAVQYEGNAWGMVIDLNACTGCNACTVACQSENNIPVVGKEQVIIGREMHWIRVDRYFKGEEENPETYHQPVPCMQCESAPCEVVCPVGATTHSNEGLNDMTYNRCVGTRYCLNNCPYKVRRFNFLLYSDFETPSLKLGRNPDVTVRSRGVMEKCTYCVQRINAVKIEAEKGDRPIRDGEIVTACEAVCPAQAITFGNLNDPASRVSRLKGEKLNYGLLADLNTRPRTTYMGRLRNPNPELSSSRG
ncbi:MAG: TAT-variant-translocated molybdopterin oxidoreductase [Terriglobia bacterium]